MEMTGSTKPIISAYKMKIGTTASVYFSSGYLKNEN